MTEPAAERPPSSEDDGSRSVDSLAEELEAELRRADEAIAAAAEALEAAEAERSSDEDASTTAGASRDASAARAAPRSHPLQHCAVRDARRVAIVTTASLPWLTGTAVNPALRAAYLANRGYEVTLLVPWLEDRTQQALIFPGGLTFGSPEAQREHVVAALRQRVPFPPPASLHIAFYPGRYDSALCSILPDSDVQDLVPPETELVILEEPEHLTWYHVGRRWSARFPAVVGIMHTNYVDYIQRQAGRPTAAVIYHLNRFLCLQHCHLVIKLSDAVQPLPHQMTCFVHGVADAFREVGAARASAAAPAGAAAAGEEAGEGSGEAGAAASSSGAGRPVFSKGAYFLGKGLWAKGFRELVDRLVAHQAWCEERGLPQPELDIYGKGEEMDQIEAEAGRQGLRLQFHGPRDHLDASMHAYRAFVNPSTSGEDVVATTSAEALAMGKWLVVPAHPCNDWFATFANCLTYGDDAGFSRQLAYALEHDPHPLTEEELERLSWEAATARLLGCIACLEDAVAARRARPAVGRAAGSVVFGAYNAIIVGIESVRKALDAGKARRARPARRRAAQAPALGTPLPAPA